MTRNQIEYLKYQESKRANIAQETETNRANVVREQQNLAMLGETSRHNLATEGLSMQQFLEQSRHNLETEAETKRSHLVNELELSTHNRNTEAETARANRAAEQHRIDQLNETIRANRSSESLRSRELQERERASRASEALTRQRNDETERANRVAEQLREQQFAHQQVIDTRKLDIEQYKADETHRSNLVYEGVAIADKVTRAGQLAENIRADLANEAENARHHIAMELKNYQPVVTLNNSSSSAGSISSSSSGNGQNPTLPSSPKSPQLPPSGGGSGSQPPKLVSTVVISDPYRGVAGEVTDAILGNNVQIVQQRYSDGSSKYFEEEIRNGRIISRKQISENEARRKAAKK